MTPFQHSIQDLIRSGQLWRLVFLISWDDLKLRYTRTKLGPLWMVLGTVIYILGLGFFWSLVFKLDLERLMPFMASGLIVWGFVMASITEGLGTFSAGASIIKGLPLPVGFHVFRQVVRLTISLCHTLPIAILVSLFFYIDVSTTIWLLPLSLVLFVLNCMWVTLFFGILGARFADLSQAISTVMPFMFFLTPILWTPDMLGPYEFIAELNPITHFIRLVREPLLGRIPEIETYGIVLGATILGWVVSLLLFTRTRHRIPFWV